MKIFIIIAILCQFSLQYNQNMAINTLYYARVAQCDRDKIAVWDCGDPCKYHPNMQDVKVIYGNFIWKSRKNQIFNKIKVPFNNLRQVQSYTGYDPDNKNIVVGFRGSHGDINWIYNFDVVQVKYPYCDNCKVHQGFYTDYLKVQDEVLKNVADLVNKWELFKNEFFCLFFLQFLQKYNTTSIFVTGHSLGSALATLCVLDVARTYQTTTPLFTFGSPRVGNKYFADYFNTIVSQSSRLVHYHDIVPHLPMQWLEYHHVSTEIWYNNEASTEFKICDGGEDPTCSDKVPVTQYDPNDHEHYIGIFCDC